MKVQVLGAHNLQTRKARHSCFLVDGVLGIDAGSLVSVLSEEELGRIQAILLTHEHFDHVRDLPTLGLAILDSPQTIEVWGLGETLESVRGHLMDGAVYPDLTRALNNAPAKYRFRPITRGASFQVLDYQVKAIATQHPVPAVGYIVKSASGGCVACTGDTGGDIAPFLQDQLSPQVLFVDVTFPDSLEARARLTGHLTPRLLGEQLRAARQQGIKLPRIVPVHLSVQAEAEIGRELAAVGAGLGIPLTPGRAGATFVDGRLRE